MTSRKLGQRVVAFSSGLLLGAGLLVSGMTDPQKVLGFLDVFGAFDPSLMFVMLGAIGVHMLAYRFKERFTARPSFGDVYVLPVRRKIDAKLVVGALLFGLGWGLGGYCPGPAISSPPIKLCVGWGVIGGLFAFAFFAVYCGAGAGGC